MKFYFLTTLFLLTLLTSCVVINLTKQQKMTKCSKHNVILKKTLVQTHYGNAFHCGYDILFYSYPNRKKAEDMGSLRPMWPIHRLALVLTCDSCTKMYKIHKQNGNF